MSRTKTGPYPAKTPARKPEQPAGTGEAPFQRRAGKPGRQVLWRVSVPAGLAAAAAELARRDFGQGQQDYHVYHDENALVFKAPLNLSGPPPWANAAAVVIAQAAGTAQLDAAAAILSRDIARAGEGDSPGRTLAAIVESRGGDRERGAGRTGSGSGGRDRGSQRTFALRSFLEGSPAALDPAARGRLEEAIRAITGLRPDSRSPAFEFQLALRADHSAALLWNRFPSQTGRGEAGALPSSTARLLVELSRPQAGDIFLDPFCGSGAIPLERARLPYKMIFAGDREEGEVARVKAVLAEPRMAKRRKTIFPKVLDARDLSRFEDAFFTAIVTDPPWGRHEKLDDVTLEELYGRFLAEAARTLAPGGRLVLLCGRSGPIADGTISIDTDFKTEARYELLVSGQKALVLCLVRR